MIEEVAHRRHGRVRFDVPVRLRRSQDASWIESRAVDLGEGGMGVAVYEGWPAGAEVRCELELDDRALELSGVVAWTEDQGARPATETQVSLGESGNGSRERRGMGIAFEAPEEGTLSELRRIVAVRRPLTSEVALDFPDQEQAVLARVEASKRGLFLRVALPILREGVQVGVRYRRPELKTRAVMGRATIDRGGGVPVLRVELQPEDAAGQGSQLPGNGAESEVGSPAQGQNGRVAGRSAADEVTVTAPHAAALPEASRGAGTGMVVVALVGLAVGLVLGRLWTPEDASVHVVSPAAAPASAAVAPVAESEVQPKPAANTGTPGATAAVDYAPAERGADEVPRVELVGHITRVRVPVRGLSEAMRIYDLSSPGVSINLPGASTPLVLDKYGVHQGLVRRVWLREEEKGVLQVRVIFTRPSVRHDVRAENGQLIVDVKP